MAEPIVRLANGACKPSGGLRPQAGKPQNKRTSGARGQTATPTRGTPGRPQGDRPPAGPRLPDHPSAEPGHGQVHKQAHQALTLHLLKHMGGTQPLKHEICMKTMAYLAQKSPGLPEQALCMWRLVCRQCRQLACALPVYIPTDHWLRYLCSAFSS